MNNTKEPMDYQITRKRVDRYTFAIDGTIAFTNLDGYEVNFVQTISKVSSFKVQVYKSFGQATASTEHKKKDCCISVQY